MLLMGNNPAIRLVMAFYFDDLILSSREHSANTIPGSESVCSALYR